MLLVQAVSEAALSRMQAVVAWGPLVALVVPRQPDQVLAGAGEDSTEAQHQARREAVNVSAVCIHTPLCRHALLHAMTSSLSLGEG